MRNQDISPLDINLNDYRDEIAEGINTLFSHINYDHRISDGVFDHLVDALYFFHKIFDTPLNELPYTLENHILMKKNEDLLDQIGGDAS